SMLANVLSWCGSRLGGAAPITASRTPPRRGGSDASAARPVGRITLTRVQRTAMKRTPRRWPPGANGTSRKSGRAAAPQSRVSALPVADDERSGGRIEKALAGVRQSIDQGRGRPEGIARLLSELAHSISQGPHAHGIGPEHRASAVDGPPVAVHPDDV